MGVLGQFVSLEDDETFIWLRAFPSEAVRAQMTDDFYTGSTWRDELRDEALSMVVDYSNVHVVVPTKRSKIP